ncbi:unnamed protein product [Effrenium voratum]|nr:unnamed protein product [Effrenium voratum]
MQVLPCSFVGTEPRPKIGRGRLPRCAEPEAEPMPSSMRAEDLYVGKYYKAEVSGVGRYGAKLNLGLDKPGFIHIKNMEEGHTNNAEDVMKMGDKVVPRVLQVKKTEVEFSLRNRPEFAKKPLWEFKVGDILEGKVITRRGRALFLDVGAMVDAYLPKENWKGAEAERGDSLKVQVEEVTGCQMTVAVP